MRKNSSRWSIYGRSHHQGSFSRYNWGFSRALHFVIFGRTWGSLVCRLKSKGIKAQVHGSQFRRVSIQFICTVDIQFLHGLKSEAIRRDSWKCTSSFQWLCGQDGLFRCIGFGLLCLNVMSLISNGRNSSFLECVSVMWTSQFNGWFLSLIGLYGCFCGMKCVEG